MYGLTEAAGLLGLLGLRSDRTPSVARRVRAATSVVVIDPLVRFGRPTVQGIATERLWELFDAGETIDQIADGYDITQEMVRAAVTYEEQLRSLVA